MRYEWVDSNVHSSHHIWYKSDIESFIFSASVLQKMLKNSMLCNRCWNLKIFFFGFWNINEKYLRRKTFQIWRVFSGCLFSAILSWRTIWSKILLRFPRLRKTWNYLSLLAVYMQRSDAFAMKKKTGLLFTHNFQN